MDLGSWFWRFGPLTNGSDDAEGMCSAWVWKRVSTGGSKNMDIKSGMSIELEGDLTRRLTPARSELQLCTQYHRNKT